MLEKSLSKVMYKEIAKHCIEYVKKLNKKYYTDAEICFYSGLEDDIRDYVSVEVQKTSAIAVSQQPYIGSGETVEYITALICISNSEMLEIMVDCNLDMQKIKWQLEFYIRHEFGHILNARNRYIGMTATELCCEWERYDAELSQHKPLRKNASYKAVIEHTLQYHSIPDEKAADDYVGITKEDIIRAVNNRYGLPNI